MQFHTVGGFVRSASRFGSRTDPVLLYTADLLRLIRRHLHPHAYADDTQIYGFCDPSDRPTKALYVSVCLSAWMTCQHGWQIGCSSTLPRLRCSGVRLLVASFRSQLALSASVTHLCSRGLCGPDLGVYTDADVTTRAHVTATVRACFAALRQIRSVRRPLSRDALLTLLRELLLSVSWNFRHTVTAATVCHECRRTPGVLGEEVGTHNPTTSLTALVASYGEDPVSVVCSGVPLP